MRATSMWLSAALLSAISTVSALNVTAGSICEAVCSDGEGDDRDIDAPSATNSSDIVCVDDDYFESGKGIKFRNCVTCLQDSTATSDDDSESDVMWFLHNVRYAFDVCLYTYPEEAESGFINSPCNIAQSCGTLQDNLENSLLETNDNNQWDYCGASESMADLDWYDRCVTCLRATSDQQYLANFLVALRAGCEQRPEAGVPVSISGTIFTSGVVNVTEPEEDIRERPEGAGSATLTTGAIVGIAAGCGLLFLGAGCLIFIYCRRQRRDARQRLLSPPPETPGGGPDAPHFITTSHKMSESISSYNKELGIPAAGHKRAYSSNAEYYDRLESDIRSQGIGLKYQTSRGGSALPAHPAYVPRAADRSQTPPVMPPLAATTAEKNNSYVMENYIRSTENAGHARSYSQPARRPDQQPQAAAQRMPPPPPPSAPKIKIPSLVLPSVPKFKGSKMYKPPQVTTQETTADSDGEDRNISRPLAVDSSRFHDRPLGAGPVLATEAPSSFTEHQRAFNKKASPIQSGNSARLYG